MDSMHEVFEKPKTFFQTCLEMTHYTPKTHTVFQIGGFAKVELSKIDVKKYYFLFNENVLESLIFSWKML